MELMPVQSTNLHAIGYDPGSMALQVQFHNGDVYAYSNVPPDVYSQMLSGDAGGVFAEIIKPQRATMPYVKMGTLPLA